MRVASIALPFRTTFQRLELEKRWWHRLAVVLFFAVLILMLLVAGVYTMASSEPANTVFKDVRYWYVNNSGNSVELHAQPQKATQIVPEAQDAGENKQNPKLDFSKSIPIHAAVEMPDGVTKEFVGKSSKEITTEWDEALHRARLKQVLLTLGVTIVAAIFISYLFQLAYRVLLYVILGRISFNS